MEIPAKFDYAEAEKKWYRYWQDNNLFKSVPDERTPYTIVIPPPNVTGVLHMGHMLNNTLQDVLIRRARMRGYNACWVPGTDHASIATEAKVVANLKERGIDKFSLTRDEFLQHAWEWTEKHGGIIQQQLKKLGASCDWSRETFTLDEARFESVIKVFVDLYNQGLIYRGYRMVNWDPQAKTTISDEEVNHKQVQGKLYYLKYPIVGEDRHLLVATTRPETILGDVAVCINPDDERYADLKGKSARVPIANREVPIITDEYVDPEFGTGCLKITPAHDVNDKNIGEKHNLEIIDVLNEDGTLNEHGLHYEGKDRFLVRREISEELQKEGFLEKIEDYETTVGTSERTGVIIEPKLSVQWFLKMKEMAKPALDAVLNDDINLIPKKFLNTYRHWMENLYDWNISRQLWWGHQIPAWYYGEGTQEFVVAETEEEALAKVKEITSKNNWTAEDLTRDPDVLDTWFSSWLWPISVFDGIRKPENEDIQYYYPTQDLVTAPEILFFWVARMIMAGYHFRDEKPFETVYLTGIVRDKEGRKMSKSLGNSPDPIGLMERYSTDAVRVGMLFTSPAGNDLPFDEELCNQGRNFGNKIWNALRLMKSWEARDLEVEAASEAAMRWFEERFKQALAELEDHFERYRISDALMTVYKLIWDDFCSWYLEAVKPAYQQPVSKDVLERSLQYMEDLMILLHPFMPFITEEIWHYIHPRQDGDSICVASWPERGAADEQIISEFELATSIVNGVRNVRAQQNIPKKDALELRAKDTGSIPETMRPIIEKMANLNEIAGFGDGNEPGFAFLTGKYEFFVPAGEAVDADAEIERIEKDLEYHRGFLQKVEKKLSNERFVNNAPEKVVEAERKKMSDAWAKIEALEERLASFK